MQSLLQQISACQHCQTLLPHPPRPVVRASTEARLLIIGQAPGLRVHNSGIPWDDPSGDRLRSWLRMSSEQFYSPSVAIVPMGFCYPGRGSSGDLPPRPECAALWHERLLNKMPNIELTLLIGQYAQRKYIDECGTLTEVVKLARRWLPKKMVLPHPSPRNNIWLKKNPWFEADILPLLHTRLSQLTLNQ